MTLIRTASLQSKAVQAQLSVTAGRAKAMGMGRKGVRDS